MDLLLVVTDERFGVGVIEDAADWSLVLGVFTEITGAEVHLMLRVFIILSDLFGFDELSFFFKDERFHPLNFLAGNDLHFSL